MNISYFNMSRWAFDPTMLASDGGKWMLTSSGLDQNSHQGPVGIPNPVDGVPLLSKRKIWLASVTCQPPSPTLSPTSSFSSSDSAGSSATTSSFISFSTSSLFSPYFSNENFAIKPSPKGGLGAFAIRDIPVNTTIIAESPLVKVSTCEEVPWRYEDLSRENKKAYDSLHYWVGIDTDRVIGIFKTNRFELKGKSGVFSVCSRFNHACHPFTTCTYSWDTDEQRMRVSALRDITTGEELTISYMGYSVDRNILMENYGFECDCQGCLKQNAIEGEVKELTTVIPQRRRHRF